MRSFFDSMVPWERNDGKLHVYALPDDALLERLTTAQGRIRGIEDLPLMPEPWLHFTVSQLPQHDDLGGPALSRLADALGGALAGLESFAVDLGAPRVGPTAVTCEAAPTSEWDRLVDAVREAASTVTDEQLPARPFTPHLSLGYATGDVDAVEVELRLSGAEPLGRFVVDQVHLVSVTVRPELGTFDWVELANWHLPSA